MKTILQIVDFFVENGIIPTWMCISHTEGKGENAGSFQFTHTSYYLNKYNPVHGRINAQPGVSYFTHDGCNGEPITCLHNELTW